jgi:hypothetical protein
MSRLHLQSWTAAVVLVLAAGTWGCDRSSGSADSSRSTVAEKSITPSAPQQDDTAAAAIRREAQSLYVYGPERSPVRATDSNFTGPVVEDRRQIPKMWISTATLKDSTTRPAHRIIARIRSEGRYAALGIGTKYSYVWRSSWDTTQAQSWITKVVASDTTVLTHLLRRDSRHIPYSHGEPREPRLVQLRVHSWALVLCLDDPVCHGHCGSY